ncbi:hypothetical protein ACIFQM_08210 [Paenibacillus sp. NRS-1782]|uniref:hypothetical protein n=1 Tax=unclassified Paenibacillus TaxID=185978 RepID=UPI003D27BE8B
MLITKNKTAAFILRIIFFSLLIGVIYFNYKSPVHEVAKLVEKNKDYLVIQSNPANGGEYKKLYISSKSVIPHLVVGEEYFFKSEKRYFEPRYISSVED